MVKKNEKKEESGEKIKVKGIGVSDFISKDIKDYFEKNLGQSLFPFLGIALLEKEEFIFIIHEEFESIPDKIVTIVYEKKSTKKDLDKLVEFLKKR